MNKNSCYFTSLPTFGVVGVLEFSHSNRCVVESCFFFKDWLIDWLIAMLGLRFCARAPSSCSKLGPPFIAVHRPPTTAASLVAEHRPQMRRLSSRGTRAQPLRGMRDPPRPGLEPASPALAGRLSTTAPPGKPNLVVLICISLMTYGVDHLFMCLFATCISSLVNAC